MLFGTFELGGGSITFAVFQCMSGLFLVVYSGAAVGNMTDLPVSVLISIHAWARVSGGTNHFEKKIILTAPLSLGELFDCECPSYTIKQSSLDNHLPRPISS